jgi:predicted nucleic acid-binding protein
MDHPVKPRVYIETSVIGYLTSSLQRDLEVAGHQYATREWWTTAFDRFDLFASQLVFQEASGGDPQAARGRVEALRRVKLLPTTSEAEILAQGLLLGHAVPETEPEDALHIALAATHGAQFLVTWNFRHIANAAVRPAIERVCRDAGYEPPIICTPEELSES